MTVEFALDFDESSVVKHEVSLQASHWSVMIRIRKSGQNRSRQPLCFSLELPVTLHLVVGRTV